MKTYEFTWAIREASERSAKMKRQNASIAVAGAEATNEIAASVAAGAAA